MQDKCQPNQHLSQPGVKSLVSQVNQEKERERERLEQSKYANIYGPEKCKAKFSSIQVKKKKRSKDYKNAVQVYNTEKMGKSIKVFTKS